MTLSSRPHLPNVAFPLTDHCNLNCRRCGHFSSVADTKFADTEVFRKDMMRLAELFETIDSLSLMGGEPLLHPDPGAFMKIAREVFPKSRLLFFTNGLLLKKMRSEFWEACRYSDVTLELRLYPPLKGKSREMYELCRSNGAKAYVREVDSFFAWMNLQGDSDPKQAFDYCKAQCDAWFLHQSRLYTCAIPPNVHYFNAKYGTSIPRDAGVDLFEEGLTGEGVLKRLNSPISSCRFCAEKYVSLPWERGAVSKEDWDVPSPAVWVRNW